MARSANREAVAYFDQALDALQHCLDDGGTIETPDGGSNEDPDSGSPPPPPPASEPPTSTTVGCVTVDFLSQDQNTFCYRVTEIDNCKDLSHWDLATNCSVSCGSPLSGFVVGTDPKSGIKGVKWNTSSSFDTGTFCLTVEGKATLGEVQVASKSGIPFSYSTIAGPVCSQ